MKLVPKFSSKPVKQVIPGQDVGVSITMTPLPPPCEEHEPCPPCPCAPTTVGWAIQPTPGQTYALFEPGNGEFERHPWVTPDLVDAYHEDKDGENDTNTAGRPVIMRMDTLPRYGDFTEATPPDYTNPHKSWLFLGLPFGESNAIRWEWTWTISADLPTAPANTAAPEAESWWAGHETEQVGNFLQVRILHGYYDVWISGNWSAELTAKAYCGDAEVGTLVLKLAMISSAF